MDLWHFTPVAIVYFVTSGISFLLAFLAWKMRRVKAAGLFSLMMLFVGVWVVASLLGVFSNSYNWKILMLKFEYLGMAGAVYLWLVFVAEYTQFNKWLKKWVFILLAIIPAITLFYVFQAPNETHIHTSYYLVTIKGISVFDQNYGGGFYLWASYAYLMMLVGVVFLVLRIIQTPKVMRNQLILLIPAVFVVMLPNIMFITRNNPIEPFDPTPLALVVVGILFLSTFYFYHFLNVVPVAHNLVFRNVRAGVIIVNSKNLILELNPVAESIIGSKQDDIAGLELYQVLPECLETLCESAEDSEIKTEITLGVAKKSYELKVTLLKDSSSNPQGKIIMLWDITDQKMAMKELDAYARTVAHDLKTPLGHMMGFAQLLKDDDVSEKERNNYLQNILEGGEKIKDIIDGLLMLAKIRNQESIELSQINMHTIMHSVLARLNSSVEKHSAVIHIPKSWEAAMGNSIWVEEVWVNLLSNAIKYGGKPPVIEIGSEKSEKFTKFWIKDNGNGLSPEEQQQIFEEFARIHPSKDTIKGHGLGLSIVQRIIDKMGGEVSVESKPGSGCTFTFTLPTD